MSLSAEISALGNGAPEIAPLPLAHFASVQQFESICKGLQLEPQECRILEQRVLYLFYGGLFYRKTTKLSESDLDLPIAFVFKPAVLNEISMLVPFDSGAALTGKYGPWPRKGRRVLDYFVDNDGYTTAPRLVCCFFGNNENYLNSEYRSVEGTGHIAEVLTLYANDLTGQGIDRRKYSIECIGRKALTFGTYLEWLAFPEACLGNVSSLLKRLSPNVPDYYPYKCGRVKSPLEVCAILNQKMKTTVLPKYLRAIPPEAIG
jgi:hypothetical protein